MNGNGVALGNEEVGVGRVDNGWLGDKEPEVGVGNRARMGRWRQGVW